jgi:murein DD-endopeptidase MepM/ murein hydrolase activator NlpD
MRRLPNRRWRIASAALGAGLLAGTLASPAAARPGSVQAPSGVAQETTGADLKEEWEEILGEEAELLDELDDAKVAREEAGNQLTSLNRETRDKQLELVGAQADLDAAEAAALERVAERIEAEKKVGAAEERLRQQIVRSYISGGEHGGQLEAFMNANSGEQVGQARAYGRAISGSTAGLVDELEAAKKERSEAEDSAADAKDQARSTRDEVDAAARFLVESRERQQELVVDLNAQVQIEAEALSRVQGRKAIIQGRVNALVATSDGVAGLLASLQANQDDWEPGAFEITTPLPGMSVGSKFGMRFHPILGISRLHAGADFGAPSGMEIHAPADGVVVLAEVRGGYGNTIVIDHGDSLGTLYGHTSAMLVKPGDQVLRGEVIGLVGSTGLSTGPHLHFETRIKGQPIDPEIVIDFEQEVDYDALLADYETFFELLDN